MNTANSSACPLAVLPFKRIEPLRISSLVSMKDKLDDIFYSVGCCVGTRL
nr:MAG TPA: hypothetical protein [Caudoviricetes sp.]